MVFLHFWDVDLREDGVLWPSSTSFSLGSVVLPGLGILPTDFFIQMGNVPWKIFC